MAISEEKSQFPNSRGSISTLTTRRKTKISAAVCGKTIVPRSRTMRSVGRKGILRRKPVSFTFCEFLCRNSRNLPICIGYHDVFAFEYFLMNHLLTRDFHAIYHLACKFAVSFLIFHDRLFLRIKFHHIQPCLCLYRPLPQQPVPDCYYPQSSIRPRLE